MLKEFVIKGGLMVGALVVAGVIIDKLEDRALKKGSKTVESEGEGNELTEKEKWQQLKPRVVETLARHKKA